MASISKDNIKIVLFCGGKGTRMWPISKIGHPKQFNPILGEKSFFRESLLRVLKGFSRENVFISTGRDYKPVIEKQAPELPKENIIYEPEMRDNLGAVGLASATLNHRYPNSVMILLWGADHYVKKKEKFIKVLNKAAQLAWANDVIVHVDMKPTYPSVHNGWIRMGKKIRKEDGFEIYEFLQHMEKPDLKTAKKFFQAGNYLIHSGYMATKPRVLLEKYKNHASDCYRQLTKISHAMGTDDYDQVLEREYKKIVKMSVDYGLFEKLKPGSQWELPVDIGWIDLGTWELLYQGVPKDKNGNVILGKAEVLEAKNCLILSRGKKIVGVIGASNMVIVETDQGILVSPLAKTPLVKQLYKKIYS